MSKANKKPKPDGTASLARLLHVDEGRVRLAFTRYKLAGVRSFHTKTPADWLRQLLCEAARRVGVDFLRRIPEPEALVETEPSDELQHWEESEAIQEQRREEGNRSAHVERIWDPRSQRMRPIEELRAEQRPELTPQQRIEADLRRRSLGLPAEADSEELATVAVGGDDAPDETDGAES